jgi:hypothetical protein
MRAGGDQSQAGATSVAFDDKADTLGAGLFFFLFPFSVAFTRRD